MSMIWTRYVRVTMITVSKRDACVFCYTAVTVDNIGLTTDNCHICKDCIHSEKGLEFLESGKRRITMRVYKSYELTTMRQLREHNPNYDFENDEIKMFEMKSTSQDEPPEHLANYEVSQSE